MADGLRYRIAAGSCALLALTWPASAAEGPPKRGGTLTYLIPADSPPSFDGHREGTFAMVHATAPFYSTLIRINPVNPSSTTDFVCDLCTGMPEPGDGGKTYVFELRNDVKFHDAARDELKANLGDRLAVQESDWDCGSFVEANHKRKPFDDV